MQVRLEDIVESLSRWSLQEKEQGDQIRALKARVEELELLIAHAITQIEETFELPRQGGTTLALIIETAALATRTRGAEAVRTVERQRTEITDLSAKIKGLEEEARESIDRLIKELELPPHPHRTLRNAVTEVTVMVTEAKKMVAENL